MQGISLLAGELLAFQKDFAPWRFNFSDTVPIISELNFLHKDFSQVRVQNHCSLKKPYMGGFTIKKKVQ